MVFRILFFIIFPFYEGKTRLFQFFPNLLAGFIILLSAFVLQAAEITPFYTQNRSPLVQISGLPPIGNSSLLTPGRGDFRLTVDLANNFVDDHTSDESIILDGEETRISLDARYGISRNFEIGIVIPYVIQSGGFLDGFIDGVHDTFGASGGGRDQAPKNRLLYRYVKDGQERLNLHTSSAGLGDISLSAAWQVYGGPNQTASIALRSSLELPTGDTSQLHGGGSMDLSLWLVGGRNFSGAYGLLNLFGAAGLLGMTDGNVLEGQQENLVAFGSLGIGWSPTRWIALKIQANANTPFYHDSELISLSQNSVQLTVGGTLAFSQNTTLDVGFTQDIIKRTSPDALFHLSLRHQF